jgi:hypothetical protein
MTADRILLLSPDPVSAWRTYRQAGWRGRIFLSSLRASASYDLRGLPATTLERWASAAPIRIASPFARRRALLAAVREVGIGAERDVAGYASVAAVALRELLRHADLDAPTPSDDARFARWWEVAQRYRANLALHAEVDPAEALRVAARVARAAGGPTTPLAHLGSLDLRSDEVEVVDALAGPGSLVILPYAPPWTDANTPARNALRGRGWREEIDAGPAPMARVAAWHFESREVEVVQALAEVKRALLAGTPPGELLIGTRDLNGYAPLVRHAAAAAGVPLRVERWLPLLHTPLGGALRAYLDAVTSGGAFEPTLAWLAHPQVARLDVDAIAAVRRYRPEGVRGWQRFDEVASRLLDWPRRATPAAWRERLGAGWQRNGLTPRVDPVTLAPLPADVPPLFAEPTLADPFDHPALQPLWSEALDALLPLCDARGEVGRAAVLATLRDALRAETVWEGGEEGEPAVALRPLEGLADGRAERVWLLGAVDGVLPAPIPDDPVLGLAERAELIRAGVPLPSAGDLARREGLHFWGVLRAATGSAWVGVPEQMGNDARIPSPYLEAFNLEPQPPSGMPLATPGAFRRAALRHPQRVPSRRDPQLTGVRARHKQALRRLTDPGWGPDDGFVGIGVAEGDFSWSATALTDLATCRFKWWVKFHWGVRAPEEGAVDLTPLLEGQLYHLTLERALKAALNLRGADAREAAAAALEEAFAHSEHAVRVAEVVPHWARRRGEHLGHLRALIEASDFIPDDHQLLALEQRFAGEWHGWQVKGLVDRIDRTPHGLELIDYKLGSSRGVGARDLEGKPSLDLQLPLYADVAAPAAFPDEQVARTRYLSLRQLREIPSTPPNDQELSDLFARLRASLTAGFFPVEPDDAVCKRCDLALVCRKGAHLDLKPLPFYPPAEGST